jgi:hypothetical protein
LRATLIVNPDPTERDRIAPKWSNKWVRIAVG